jgi:hypothetical protein
MLGDSPALKAAIRVFGLQASRPWTPLAADQPRRLLSSGGGHLPLAPKGERWVPRGGFTLPASGSDLRRGKIGTLAKKRSPKRSRNFGMIRFLLGEKTERSAH